MVSIVNSAGLGLFNSSLGLQSAGSSPMLGQAGERVYVNNTTGNLVIQHVDDILSSQGPDFTFVRTYNSLGQFDGENNDNWRFNVYQQVYGLTGTVNTAGSSVVKVFGDGYQATYNYDNALGYYTSTDGDGAHDRLRFDAQTQRWSWEEGSSNQLEVFNFDGRLVQLTDKDGNSIGYIYQGSQISQIVDQSGQITYFDYQGQNLTQVRTYSNGVWQTRVRYNY